MHNQLLVDALRPITSRMRTDVCWVIRDGVPSRIDSPLDDTAMGHHVNGGPAYGAAPIQAGESVTRIAVLDLDSHKGEVPWAGMQDVAAKIIDAAELTGLRAMPFRSSGGHGMHIYFLWDTPQDAYSVRILLKEVLAQVGLVPGTGGVAKSQVEIFPKQNSVGANAFGNMFVLPLANKSVPLDTLGLDPIPKDWLSQLPWPMSRDVPQVVKVVEEKSPITPMSDFGHRALESALAAISNGGAQELEYDTWRNVIFAIHHATDGEGIDLAHQFSARSSKYNKEFLDERVWPYIKSDHDAEHGGITIGTIFKLAGEHGWTEPVAASVFEVIELKDDAGNPIAEDLPSFKRDKRGEIEATLPNVLAALRRRDVCDVWLRYDMFRGEIVGAFGDETEWRSFTDTDYTRIREHLEHNSFKPVSKEMVRDAVAKVAEEHSFDSAIEWINGLQWDGVPRIDTFLSKYFSTEDTDYARAVSRYMWTAMAGRVLTPGCQADMALILVGGQGLQKSSAIMALVPDKDQYVKIDLDSRDDEQARQMRCALIGEIEELKGLATRDANSIKAFITRRRDEWIPKYKEFKTIAHRRSIFIGTTNDSDFLTDPTGNRRWLPIEVGNTDIKGIEAARDQLWAEAKAIFTATGIAWQDAEILAKDEHDAFRKVDTWEHMIVNWLDSEADLGSNETNAMRKNLRLVDILQEALGLDLKNVSRREETRVCSILQVLGYERVQTWENGKKIRVWRKTPQSTARG